ncbi:hypothetical protein TEA_024756 [Camellia sinensis var. sinensis]|uniref:Uncharacterized protein n=1 Tax=Camellia sinensis var. sinensis TaxID=542762 RepID=A0A4S4DXN4_CAMSN|nr:hypothetical protein TEA_024756 [Camellia sinensis var. sinensis]
METAYYLAEWFKLLNTCRIFDVVPNTPSAEQILLHLYSQELILFSQVAEDIENYGTETNSKLTGLLPNLHVQKGLRSNKVVRNCGLVSGEQALDYELVPSTVQEILDSTTLINGSTEGFIAHTGTSASQSRSPSVQTELIMLSIPAIAGQAIEPLALLMETAYIGRMGLVLETNSIWCISICPDYNTVSRRWLENMKTMESETNSIDRAVANLSKVDSGGINLLAAVSSKEEAKGTTKQCNYSLN